MADKINQPKRLKRSALLHYIDTSFNTDSTSYAWFLIGKDVSELSVNPA